MFKFLKTSFIILLTLKLLRLQYLIIIITIIIKMSQYYILNIKYI